MDDIVNLSTIFHYQLMVWLIPVIIALTVEKLVSLDLSIILYN